MRYVPDSFLLVVGVADVLLFYQDACRGLGGSVV